MRNGGIEMSQVTKCEKCTSLIEYYPSDIQNCGNPYIGEDTFYIICPVCGNTIYIGYYI